MAEVLEPESSRLDHYRSRYRVDASAAEDMRRPRAAICIVAMAAAGSLLLFPGGVDPTEVSNRAGTSRHSVGVRGVGFLLALRYHRWLTLEATFALL